MKNKESIKCEPLRDATRISGFDCGNQAINSWYRTNAHEDNEISRSYHLIVNGTPVGFFAIYATKVRRGKLKQFHSEADKYPTDVPIFCIGQFAIRTQFQGQGYSKQLMFNALKICVCAQKISGGRGIIVEPFDASLIDLYDNFGFIQIQQESKKLCMYMPIEFARDITSK